MFWDTVRCSPAAKDLTSLERSLSVIGGADLTESAGAVTWDDFRGCYDATVVAVHRYLFRACGGDRSLAEDLAQDVYTAALVRARDGDATVLVLPWLLAVARNKLVDHFRRVERERRKLALVERDVAPSTADRDGRLIARLESLPPLQRGCDRAALCRRPSGGRGRASAREDPQGD